MGKSVTLPPDLHGSPPARRRPRSWSSWGPSSGVVRRVTLLDVSRC